MFDFEQTNFEEANSVILIKHILPLLIESKSQMFQNNFSFYFTLNCQRVVLFYFGWIDKALFSPRAPFIESALCYSNNKKVIGGWQIESPAIDSLKYFVNWATRSESFSYSTRRPLLIMPLLARAATFDL